MREKQAIEKTKELLIKIIQNQLKDIKQIAICFSGSLDSTLVAFIVKNYTDCHIQLYTIGFPKCYDFKQSLVSADLLLLKHNHKLISLQKKSLINHLKNYISLTKDKNKVSISYTLPFYILLKNIPEKHVITGHGADTLFGGFYKYLNVKNLKLEIQNCYAEFKNNLPKREFKIAEKFNKRLIMPFTNKELANFVMQFPNDFFIKNGVRKYLLRKVARELGLPNELADQPKKAFQYSSGVMKKLRHSEFYTNKLLATSL